MPPDVVQIGPLVISKAAFDVLAPLLGTLIGGLITYLSTRAIEDRRWKQQKLDTYKEKQRDSLEQALEWIKPVRGAFIQSTTLGLDYFRGKVDDQAVLSKWPDIWSEVVTTAMPQRLRQLLPKRLVQLISAISTDMINLQEVLLASPLSYQDWDVLNKQLIEDITAFELEIDTAYKNTFE